LEKYAASVFRADVLGCASVLQARWMKCKKWRQFRAYGNSRYENGQNCVVHHKQQNNTVTLKWASFYIIFPMI
jgi:hypothetical protein